MSRSFPPEGADAVGSEGVGSGAAGVSRTSDSEKVAIIRRFSDAFNRLDIDSLIDGLDPEIELREWPTAPGAQVYHGHDGVRRALDTWFESWDWMRVEILELLEADDRVLVTAHQRARGKGSKVEVEIKSFNVYTFRDRKVVRIELHTERAAALEAAGLAPQYEEENR
jgi:ketosteroid isomerase-like protein